MVSPSPGLPDLPDPGGEEGPVLGPEAPGLRGRDLHRADTEEGAGGGRADDTGTETSDDRLLVHDA